MQKRSHGGLADGARMADTLELALLVIAPMQATVPGKLLMADTIELAALVFQSRSCGTDCVGAVVVESPGRPSLPTPSYSQHSHD